MSPSTHPFPFAPTLIRVISFDAGGTLLHPDPSVGETYAEFLGQHGGTADPEELNHRFAEAFERLTLEKDPVTDPVREWQFWREVVLLTLHPYLPDPSRFEELFEQIYRSYEGRGRWRLADGTRETLAALRERNLQVVLFSNNDERVYNVLEAFGLGDSFDAVFLSAEIGCEKPSPKAFAHVQERLGVPPHSILHIGDSLRSDGRAALAAGWQACLLAPSHDPEGRIPTLTGLTRLLDWLEH